jgi:hypothetical protein
MWRDDVGIQHILQVKEHKSTMFKIKLQILNTTCAKLECLQPTTKKWPTHYNLDELL